MSAVARTCEVAGKTYVAKPVSDSRCDGCAGIGADLCSRLGHCSEESGSVAQFFIWIERNQQEPEASPTVAGGYPFTEDDDTSNLMGGDE